MSKTAASVKLVGVSKRYTATAAPAVDTIDLDIAAGKLVTLLGPSGCGKTTTLRLIAGLETVTAGHIFVDDHEVTALPTTERDISMVFQSYALFPHMNVVDNVAFGLRMSGQDKEAARKQAEAGLEKIGLAGFGNRLPSELSGGQQQRVAVARALVLEPRVLLFDEPLSNLDARLRRKVREDIRDLQQNLGLTVVYVTHDQEEALAVSDVTVVMDHGTIAQVATPRELYEKPTNKFVADFIGEANLLTCQITAVTDAVATIALAPLELQSEARGLSPGPALLAVRPDQVNIANFQPGMLPATLRKVTYVGRHIEYVLSTEHGEIFAISADTQQNFTVASKVGISFADPGPVLIPQD